MTSEDCPTGLQWSSNHDSIEMPMWFKSETKRFPFRSFISATNQHTFTPSYDRYSVEKMICGRLFRLLSGVARTFGFYSAAYKKVKIVLFKLQVKRYTTIYHIPKHKKVPYSVYSLVHTNGKSTWRQILTETASKLRTFSTTPLQGECLHIERLHLVMTSSTSSVMLRLAIASLRPWKPSWATRNDYMQTPPATFAHRVGQAFHLQRIFPSM